MKLGFLWQRARSFSRELTLISGLTILSSLATLAVPWFAGQLLGGLFETRPSDLYQIAGLLMLALVAMTAFGAIASIVSASTAGKILARLRVEAYDHIQVLPMGFHDRSRHGDLLAMMTYEVSNLSDFLTSTLANAPAMLLTAAGAVLLLFLINPNMALFVPLLVPAFYILMKLMGRRLRLLAKQVRKVEAEMMWTADSDLEMLPAVKAFSAEKQYSQGYAEVVERARKLTLREDRITVLIAPIIGLVAALAAILIVLFGGTSMDTQGSSPGELFAFLLYAALLTRPVGGLANVYGRFQLAKGTIARLEKVFATKPEPGYALSESLGDVNGELSFDKVSFGYQGRKPVFEGIDLHIKPGEIVALTGANGVGKSTLIRLLLRFYDPDSGTICVDGRNVAHLQVQELRRQFGYVPQRALLFSGSIRDNIAFGKADVSESALEQAARLAQAWDFICALPEGMATQIGDHGIRLSGGQRQRIALARALLRDPPILIFDEATSMYDLESEAAFIDACKNALADRTVIIVTHRPASLALASRIFDVSECTVREVSADQMAGG